MTRQVLHGHVQLAEFFDVPVMQVEPGVLELAFGSVIRILPFESAHQTRKPGDRLFIEAHRLADFARRRTPTIGDDVCGHRRAVRAVTLIDVLNYALALISARQVEIDVRPFAAFFGKKALE